MSAAISTSMSTATATYASPIALTTTFTAPTQCFPNNPGGGFTMLVNRDYEIWLNEIYPVPGLTVTSCYPSQYVTSYQLEQGKIPQAALSPLVCPSGWSTVAQYTSNYIACCPSGWGGVALRPEKDYPSNRPASGATCYTAIYNTGIHVTEYDDTHLLGSSLYTASSVSAQAYAHVYEGFALGVAVLGSLTSTGGTASPTNTNNTSNPNDTHNHHRASAGVIAGAVIGSVLGAIIIFSAIFLFFRNRRIRNSQAHNTQNSSFGYAGRETINSDYPSPLTAFSRGSHTNSNTTTLQPSSGEHTMQSVRSELDVSKDENYAHGSLGVHELEAQPGVTEMDTNGFGSPRYNEKQH